MDIKENRGDQQENIRPEFHFRILFIFLHSFYMIKGTRFWVILYLSWF
jgi:hypothetical protein